MIHKDLSKSLGAGITMLPIVLQGNSACLAIIVHSSFRFEFSAQQVAIPILFVIHSAGSPSIGRKV